MPLQLPYRDPARPIDERVDDLLARMTIEEKAGLMFHTMVMVSPDGAFNPDVGAFGLAWRRFSFWMTPLGIPPHNPL